MNLYHRSLTTTLILATCLVTLFSATRFPAAAQGAAEPVEAVVLAVSGDAYYPLAQEIAGAEALPLAQSWEEALAYDPPVILWVASPGYFSDTVIVEAGLALKRHTSLPAIGIFSGATQEGARQLWQRGQQLRAQGRTGAARYFAANGEHPEAGTLQPQLIDFQAESLETVQMDKASLTGALQQADYLSYTGHGSDDYLRLDPDTTLVAGDLPALPPVVVGTGSCQTMRIWSPESIAIAFVRQGAAAYAGFVYSPLEGYLIGQFRELPFRYTWPEFPIGNVIALQTRGTLQGYASFPYHYLLGDPRIALQAAPPYQITGDEVNGSVRTLTIQGAPSGLIPVRVPGGGRYAYVEVPGWAATADGDPFFSARIQAASLGGDRYILVNHPGGDFTLRLQEAAPWHWWLTHSLTASFDDVTLFSPMNGGDAILLILGGLFLLVALLRGWKVRKKTGQSIRPVVVTAVAAGLAVALLMGLYQALRLPHATITTKPMSLAPLWIVSVFLITACGSSLFLMARSWPGKLLALMVAAAPALFPAIFGFLATEGINLLIRQRTGAGVYNNHLGSLPLIAAVVWMVVLGAALGTIEKRRNKGLAIQEPS